MLDVNRIRAEFPILGRTVHGKPLVYLDNAASTQKPRAVIERLARFYSEEYSNIHGGPHALAERATAAYEGARAAARRFLNAAADREIVFVRGTTEAINLVAHSYSQAFMAPGDEIVITALEHHSNIVPWQLIRKERGTVLRVAPITDDGELDMDAFAKLLGPRTKLVAITHISNALGTVTPVRRIVEMAHALRVPVLVDGAQSAPHLAIDVQAMGCDFYAFSGHKVYGPTGVGVLYGKGELLEAMPPYQGGGGMIDQVTFDKTTYGAVPAKFEAGTPHIAGVVGLGTALEYVAGVGHEAIAAHESEVLAYATARIAEIPRVRVIGRAREKAAALSFVVDGIHPHDVATVLDREGIAIRAGHHCAQPVMRRYGIAATARASLGMYNTREEIDACIAGIEKAVRVLG